MHHPFSRPTQLLALLACVLGSPFVLPAHAAAPAANDAQSAEAEAAYSHTISERAQKIVDTLGIDCADRADRVRDIIANQYRSLRDIHDARDARLAALTGSATEIAAARQSAENEAKAKLYALHAEFLARLSVELTPEQIDGVKNGLTYGVCPNTFRVYCEMLPDLTDEQKRQIHAWLIEAREFAMDAGSSKEKHGWFGKYKGRINNYLAKAGIDMKQAEKAMLDRKQAATAE